MRNAWIVALLLLAGPLLAQSESGKAPPAPTPAPSSPKTEGAPPTLTGETQSPPSAPTDDEEDPHKLGSREESSPEFHELSLAIRPGFASAETTPLSDDQGFSIGAHVSLFLASFAALNVPYEYTQFTSDGDFHSIGGGPLLRYLDWKVLRGEIDANILYVRAGGGDHLGWSGGIDLTAGFRNATLRPFFGPFFRYEQFYLPGRDQTSYIYGFGITLTNLADIH